MNRKFFILLLPIAATFNISGNNDYVRLTNKCPYKMYFKVAEAIGEVEANSSKTKLVVCALPGDDCDGDPGGWRKRGCSYDVRWYTSKENRGTDSDLLATTGFGGDTFQMASDIRLCSESVFSNCN